MLPSNEGSGAKHMAGVVLFERARTSVPESLAHRGHHIVYRTHAENHCPGCGRSNWYIGRHSAECGFCGTAVPLAEARMDADRKREDKVPTGDTRRYPRLATKGRKLQLLIDGSPSSFAMENISAGGAMGGVETELAPGMEVKVRFEGGILIPAVVKWTDNGLVGLAFAAPIQLDNGPQ